MECLQKTRQPMSSYHGCHHLPQADLDTGLSTRLVDGAREGLSGRMTLTKLKLLHVVAEAGWAKPWSWTVCWHALLLAGTSFPTCRRTLPWKQPSSCLNGQILNGEAGCMEPEAWNIVETSCFEGPSFHSTDLARAGSCAVEAGGVLGLLGPGDCSKSNCCFGVFL